MLHAFAEQFAAFRLFDGLGVGADELDAAFLQHAHARQLQRHVQCRLPSQRGEYGVGPLLAHDGGHGFRLEGFDVRAVRKPGIRHDGGRVGIDEDDLETFGLKGLDGLGAGVVELAGLPDDDRSGPDDHDSP